MVGACQNPAASPVSTSSPVAYPNGGTALTACPTPPADELAQFESRSVTAADNGKTLVVHQTDRFSVFLDDRTYPLDQLHPDPAGMLGYISNGSVRGPNCYPIMFEAVDQGQATLSDRGFVLHVVINNNAPISEFPLH